MRRSNPAQWSISRLLVLLLGVPGSALILGIGSAAGAAPSPPPESEAPDLTYDVYPGPGGEDSPSPAAPEGSADPRVMWLWYADGGPVPSNSYCAASKKPPKFECMFGSSTEDCQRQVQVFLDRWYANFN